ncbi:hypothetical protein [Tenuifilum osseticum]|uniref:hypothetical protein n=1 Tax=Tenuifilum TaxID=2760873 RepID=UPI0030ACCB5B
MKTLANQLGSVDDIRNHLKHLNPATVDEARHVLAYLDKSWIDEINNRARSSVLKLLDAKSNAIYKQFNVKLYGEE